MFGAFTMLLTMSRGNNNTVAPPGCGPGLCYPLLANLPRSGPNHDPDGLAQQDLVEFVWMKEVHYTIFWNGFKTAEKLSMVLAWMFATHFDLAGYFQINLSFNSSVFVIRSPRLVG